MLCPKLATPQLFHFEIDSVILQIKKMKLMRSTFNVLFFIKKNAEKKDGKAPIVARITINGNKTHFNTKQFIKPDDWSVALNKAKGKSAETRTPNGVLDEIKTSLRNAYNDLNRKKIAITTEKVKNTFLGIGLEQFFLMELFEESNNTLKQQIGINKSKATYQKAEVCRRHLSNYLKTEYKRTDIDLREINYSFTHSASVNKSISIDYL